MPLQFPSSTYRLHLTGAFTLQDAADLVDHVDALGVDWLYASPIQTVPEGATHGYHILDPDSVNPELGGRAALETLHERLSAHGRGLVLDIVPNHVAASVDNPWWADVLANGPESVHATTFDIDHDAGPIVLPVLGGTVQEAIAEGSLRVEDGRLRHHGLSLPLAPGTDPDAPIEEVLEAQHYRLHQWQEGERMLNWRRFFAVNELAGVRVEDPRVFDLVHRAILGWIQEGLVQGLRVDHIDGLVDPTGYLQTLRHAIGAGRWLVVEKIVEQGEDLPHEWPVQGTTGYEVSTMLQAWLTDPAGHRTLRTAFAEATAEDGLGTGTAAALPGSKLAAVDELFGGEVDRVVRALVPAAHGTGTDTDDIDTAALREGLRHLTAHLRGYRTYTRADGPVRPDDLQALEQAADAAAAAGCTTARTVAGLLASDAGRPALLRWQQLTGPAAAKGFEDRLLFRDVALSGLNEVGADAHLLDGLPTPDAVARFLTDRAATSPLAGSTTSTHDTKRSEDVRARLTMLAEDPQAFLALYEQVTTMLADTAPRIEAHARWLLLQTVVGSLGLEPEDRDAEGVPSPAFVQRIQDFAGKALREAGVHTSHRQPDADHDAAVAAWVDALLAPGPALQAVDDLVRTIAVAAATTSLGLVLLKIAGPGVPDIYRGCEVWDGSLTDPDNRRPLAVDRIRALMAGLDGADVTDVRDRWADGGLKLLVTREALRTRREHPAAALSTACEVVPAVGQHSDHVAAVLRRPTDTGPAGVADPASHPSLMAIATRLPLTLAGQGWAVGALWGDTTLAVPPGTTSVTDRLTGRTVPLTHGAVRLADALSTLPTALLEIR